MTARKPKLIPAVARLDDRPRKPTKAQRIRQHRQAAAWQRRVADSGGDDATTPGAGPNAESSAEIEDRGGAGG